VVFVKLVLIDIKTWDFIRQFTIDDTRMLAKTWLLGQTNYSCSGAFYGSINTNKLEILLSTGKDVQVLN